MSLVIYNTLSREKEPFAPLDAGHVRMYVCGPTVYDYVHIGNARPVVAFDVLYRLLKRRYPRVTYVRNITDIDDRIMVRAADNGETIEALTSRTSNAYQSDMLRLGALAPDVEPRATQYVAEMIGMIQRLVDNGHAYAAEGHVLFSVPSMSDYGRLSRRTRDELIAGARVEVAPYKKDPADFVLWKPSADNQPGWASPWGRGRPGWHIECSAMSAKHLGETFDIHAGGLDLIFPHHENEIAQSRSTFGHAIMAKYWMHNGFLNISGEKMSKSLGNFFTVHELLDQFPGEVIRLLLLSAHYRQPLDFTHEGLRPGQGDARPLVRRAARQGRKARRMPFRNRSRTRCRTTSTRRSPSAPSISSAILPSCAPARMRWGCCSRTPKPGSAGRPPARPARAMPRSKRRSPPVRPRARPATSRSPTASAMSSRPGA